MPRAAAETRRRLLDAACQVFAARGYREATVALICRKARANVAAVSYHFGGKRELYVEAWRHAHRSMLLAAPADGGVAPDAAPAQRLRGRIHALVQWAAGEDDLAFRIMDHEMANPTGLIKEVMRESIRPLRQMTEGIVTELLNGHADERTLRLCSLSVTAPCLHLLRMSRMDRRMGRVPWVRPERIDEIVEHLHAFALAGVRAVGRAAARRSPVLPATGART